MAIDVQLSDLLGLYTRAGARILGRASDHFINKFHQVFSIDDDLRHDYFRDKGISLARRHRYIQAQTLLVELHEEYPDDVEVALYLGVCYFKTGKMEQARPMLEAALEDRPDNGRLRSLLSKIYEELGEQEKLLTLLRKDCEADHENFDVHMRLGVALDRAGETAEAIKVLEQALKLDDNSLKAHRLIAILLESQGDSEKATVHHKRVIELEERVEEDASVEAVVEKSETAESAEQPTVTIAEEEDGIKATANNKGQVD